MHYFLKKKLKKLVAFKCLHLSLQQRFVFSRAAEIKEIKAFYFRADKLEAAVL